MRPFGRDASSIGLKHHEDPLLLGVYERSGQSSVVAESAIPKFRDVDIFGRRLESVDCAL